MELQELKALADKLGVKYHPATGAKKLEEKILEHCSELGITLEEALVQGEGEVDMSTNTTKEDVQKTMEAVEESFNAVEESPTDDEIIESLAPTQDSKQAALIKKLSKVRFEDAEAKFNKNEDHKRLKEAMRLVRCIITCNDKNKVSYTGEIFCVRNKLMPEIKKFVPFNVPTHIPQIMYNMLKEKEVQVFYKERSANGLMTTKSKLMPAYGIQVLDPISTEEFNAIKQRQLAEGFTGE